jgi:hypothetical protein
MSKDNVKFDEPQLFKAISFEEAIRKITEFEERRKQLLSQGARPGDKEYSALMGEIMAYSDQLTLDVVWKIRIYFLEKMGEEKHKE